MGKRRKSKILKSAQQYSFIDDLTPRDEMFFSLVEDCDLPAIEVFLATNRVNINMKNYQGITPLHLAILNDCEPLVDLFLRQKDIRIGDSLLFAIEHDNLKLLERLMDSNAASGDGDDRIGRKPDESDDGGDSESEEFPPYITPLVLAAQCGRYETVEYLLGRGHRVDRPHPPRCSCEWRCLAAAVRGNVVADGCERLHAYWAISNPTYVCCTSAADPILACFTLHSELLECGSVDQVYKKAYKDMAEKVKRFAVDLLDTCRTSDEVKLLLRTRDGCKFRGKFQYPRLITAMDHRQKEFVGHTNVQQVLETAWIGDWIEWKAYSDIRKFAHLLSRYPMLPFTVALGVFAPDSRLNRYNRLPINRMFNRVVTYTIFLVMLFAQSNADKDTVPRGAPDSATFVPVALCVMGHAYVKFQIRRVQGPRRYFGVVWNTFGTVELTLFATAYACWAATALSVRYGWLDKQLDRKYWHWADPQLVAEALFAAATVMAYLRMLFLCQLNYYIGPLQMSLGKVMRDVRKFTVFLAVVMVAFTSGLGTLYGYYAGMVRRDPDTGVETRQLDSFVTVADTFKTLFWGIFTMTPLEAPDVVISNCDGDVCHHAGGGGGHVVHGPAERQHRFTEFVGYGLFAVFEVLILIVMLNMLIAAMSDTFQRVVDNAKHEWLFGRTEVYVNFMLLDELPPPFNLLPTLRLVTRLKNRLTKRPRSAAGLYARLPDDEEEDEGPPFRQSDFQALMAELIKRYYKQKHQTHY